MSCPNAGTTPIQPSGFAGPDAGTHSESSPPAPAPLAVGRCGGPSRWRRRRTASTRCDASACAVGWWRCGAVIHCDAGYMESRGEAQMQGRTFSEAPNIAECWGSSFAMMWRTNREGRRSMFGSPRADSLSRRPILLRDEISRESLAEGSLIRFRPSNFRITYVRGQDSI